MATETTLNQPGGHNGPAVGWQPGYGTRELMPPRREFETSPVLETTEEVEVTRTRTLAPPRRGNGAAGRPLTPTEQRIHYDDKAQLQAEWDERRKAYVEEAERRNLLEREREREVREERGEERPRARRLERQPRDWVDHSVRDEPTSTLIRDFIAEAQFMASQEIRLARAELREEATAAGKGAGALGVGGAHIFIGLMAIAGCLVAALAAAIPLWLSALLVGVVFILAGALVAMGGLAKLKALNPKPEETAETLKEDREWASGLKRDVRSRRRAHA